MDNKTVTLIGSGGGLLLGGAVALVTGGAAAPLIPIFAAGGNLASQTYIKDKKPSNINYTHNWIQDSSTFITRNRTMIIGALILSGVIYYVQRVKK